MKLDDLIKLDIFNKESYDIIDSLFTIKRHKYFDEEFKNTHNIYVDGIFLRYRSYLNEVTRQKMASGYLSHSEYADCLYKIISDYSYLYNDMIDTVRKLLAELLQHGEIISTKEYDRSTEPKLLTANIGNVTIYSNEIEFNNSKYAIMSKNTYKECKQADRFKELTTMILISKYFEDNIITLLPEKNIGKLIIGTVPEEVDYSYAISSQNDMFGEYHEDTGIHTLCLSQPDVKNIELIVSTIFLPLIDDDLLNKITILNIGGDK